MVHVYCSWGTRQNTIECNKSNANVPNQHLCNNYQLFELFVTSVVWTLGYNDFVSLVCLPILQIHDTQPMYELCGYCPAPPYVAHFLRGYRYMRTPLCDTTWNVPLFEYAHSICQDPPSWITRATVAPRILQYQSYIVHQCWVCRQLDLTSTSPDDHNRHPTTSTWLFLIRQLAVNNGHAEQVTNTEVIFRSANISQMSTCQCCSIQSDCESSC